MYHIFIHSSAVGHLGCFYILAIANSAGDRHRVTYVFLNMEFCFLWVNSQKWNSWIKWYFYFQFFEEPYCFPQWLNYLTFPPAVQEGSPFSASLPALLVPCPLDDDHPNWCEVISHCGFILYFPGNQGCGARFYVPVGHLNFFFGDVSVQILCHF